MIRSDLKKMLEFINGTYLSLKKWCAYIGKTDRMENI